MLFRSLGRPPPAPSSAPFVVLAASAIHLANAFDRVVVRLASVDSPPTTGDQLASEAPPRDPSFSADTTPRLIVLARLGRALAAHAADEHGPVRAAELLADLQAATRGAEPERDDNERGREGWLEPGEQGGAGAPAAAREEGRARRGGLARDADGCCCLKVRMDTAVFYRHCSAAE